MELLHEVERKPQQEHDDEHGREPKPDNAGICSVLQILGAKWSFLIMAELAKGPRRFQQLHRDVAIVKTQSLTDALRHLEKNGIVRREVTPTVPVTVTYSLTDKGLDFQDALQEMIRWADRWDRRADR